MHWENGTPVVVTTAHRGVFFGYFVSQDNATVWLKRCRNCLRWSRVVRGVLGLAVTGPDPEARVGPAAEEAELRDVTAVLKCSSDAERAWEAAPWK